MVKYVKGNLFESEADLICHGVNCAGGFGSGVAGQIAKIYPEVREEYLKFHKETGWNLGYVQVVSVNDGKFVINCATQQEYYPRNKIHADYDAIKTCMIKVKHLAQTMNMSIAMPKIGAGLAGGDWNKIEMILKEIFQDYDCTVFYLE